MFQVGTGQSVLPSMPKLKLAHSAPTAPASGTITAMLRARKNAMSAEDLAELLDVSRQYIYDHAKRGNLPCRKLPGTIRFDPAEIADWWESRA